MFQNILGNEKIKNLLIKSVNDNKISHSYLFLGMDGIGKKLIADEFAKMILCTGENKYCDICKSCIEFETSNNPDFKIIEPDGNSIKIEQIRQIQNKIAEKPIISDKKVYIIRDSDKMTVEAQNCLLKTLEEPPEYVVIILIGSNENMFLSTIKSRCMILHFDRINNKDIIEYLNKNSNTVINSEIMLDACQGSIGKALEIVKKQDEYEKIENIINSMENENIIDIINKAEIIYKSKDDKFEILEYINVVLSNLMTKNIKYANCISIVEDTKKRLLTNTNYDMCIDNMLLNMWEKVN